MDNFEVQFGKKLRNIRTQRNVTMRELAKAVNIHHPYISQMEKGKYPSVHVLMSLCKYFNVQPSYFLDEENNSLQSWTPVIKKFEERNVTPEEILGFQNFMREINSKKEKLNGKTTT